MLDAAAEFQAARRGDLDAEALLAEALKRAGRAKFSSLAFVEPLRRLLYSYNEEAGLSAFGQRAARFDVMRALSNILSFDAAEQADPAILSRPICRPVFIAGMPRSATTFLHTLLSQDAAVAVPRSWQLIYPYPRRMPLLGLDFRRLQVKLQFRVFEMLSPGVADLHPLAADTPQECTDITAQVFQSLRFDTTHFIPSYQRWLDAYGHVEAFRFHRRFLQHLDAQAPGRRWVLKSPDHVFALDAIRTVYPDAHFVFLHRDPLSVVASCVKLTEMLRRPFTRRLDPKVVGRQVAARLIESGERMAGMTADGSILHLHYRQVVADPLGAAEKVYRHCGLEFGSAARAGMQAWLGASRGRYRRRRYDLEEFGLDPARLREGFARYMEAYAVPRES